MPNRVPLIKLKSLLPLFVLALAALIAVLAALSVGLEGVHGQTPPTTPSVSTVAITSKPRHGQHLRGRRHHHREPDLQRGGHGHREALRHPRHRRAAPQRHLHQRGNRYGTTQAGLWCVLGQEDAPCLEYQLGSPAGAFGWECLRQGPLPT